MIITSIPLVNRVLFIFMRTKWVLPTNRFNKCVYRNQSVSLNTFMAIHANLRQFIGVSERGQFPSPQVVRYLPGVIPILDFRSSRHAASPFGERLFPCGNDAHKLLRSVPALTQHYRSRQEMKQARAAT